MKAYQCPGASPVTVAAVVDGDTVRSLLPVARTTYETRVRPTGTTEARHPILAPPATGRAVTEVGAPSGATAAERCANEAACATGSAPRASTAPDATSTIAPSTLDRAFTRNPLAPR